MDSKKITYENCGVDIDFGDETKKRIGKIVSRTFGTNVLTDVGLFAGGYSIGGKAVLASADGVGTKILIAIEMDKFDTVGVDLVHHSANDIAVHNADPAFFLDYIGYSKLSQEHICSIVEGLTRGCIDVGAALIGGETAQMPDIYPAGSFDLVGFIVGTVEKDKMIAGESIQPDDVIIALPANGLHTNGYSLARKTLFDRGKLTVRTYIDDLGCTVGEALLEIHPNYYASVAKLRDKVSIHGMAHITGGGIDGNLVRVLPKNLRAKIDRNSSVKPPVFDLIQRIGAIDDDEMFRTFNMGFGYLIIVSPSDAGAALQTIDGAFVCGGIVEKL
jgi:phosphoribosylformylglycinamidine cyclo-ligase